MATSRQVLRFGLSRINQFRCFSLASRRLKPAGEPEEMDQLQKNPYYAKYADKIAKLQKYDFLFFLFRSAEIYHKFANFSTSPQEFLQKLNVLEDKSKASAKGLEERDFSMPTRPKGEPTKTRMSKEKVGLKFTNFHHQFR